jgi:hypothetical protein
MGRGKQNDYFASMTTCHLGQSRGEGPAYLRCDEDEQNQYHTAVRNADPPLRGVYIKKIQLPQLNQRASARTADETTAARKVDELARHNLRRRLAGVDVLKSTKFSNCSPEVCRDRCRNRRRSTVVRIMTTKLLLYTAQVAPSICKYLYMRTLNTQTLSAFKNFPYMLSLRFLSHSYSTSLKSLLCLIQERLWLDEEHTRKARRRTQPRIIAHTHAHRTRFRTCQEDELM